MGGAAFACGCAGRFRRGNGKIDRCLSRRQDRQMVDPGRYHFRRGVDLRRNRQSAENGIAPPFRRTLFVTDDGLTTPGLTAFELLAAVRETSLSPLSPVAAPQRSQHIVKPRGLTLPGF